jgi:PAS domain S-box-containing protein
MHRQKISVALTMIITIVAVTTVYLFGLFLVIDRIADERWRGQLHKEQTLLTDQLSESLALPLWNFDTSQIGKIMESAMKNDNVFGIVVKTAGKQGRMFVRMRDAEWRVVSAEQEFSTKGLLLEERGIHFTHEQIGIVRVIVTPKFIEVFLNMNRSLMTAILVPFELILALSLYLLFRCLVLKPLKEVEAYAGAVSSGSGALGVIPDRRYQGELESLRSSISKMVGMLIARYGELQKETALRSASEERLQATIENTPNVSVQWYDGEGRVMYWNRASERLFGWKAVEALGRTPDQLMRTPKEADEFLRLLGHIKLTGQTHGPAEYNFRRRDGSDGICLQTIFAIPCEDGSGCFVCMDVDVTERKKAEEKLQESERLYRTLFESASDAIFLIRDSRFVDCNPRTLAMFGCRREQIIGETPYHFSPPFQADGRDSKEKAFELLDSVLAGAPQVFEWTHMRADGKLFDAEVSLNRIELHSGVQVQAIVRDITERKRADEALRKSEEKFSKVFMSTPAGISVSVLNDGRILDANQEFEKMLGYSRDEIIGHTSFELDLWLDPGDREHIVRLLRTEGKVKNLELRLRAKDGHILTQRYSADTIELDGRSFLLSAFVDITERKRAEQELEHYRDHLEELVKTRTAELAVAKERAESADRLKSAFLATMSHELRTPLNSIIGFTGILIQGLPGPLNDEQRKQLGMVRESSTHLLALINDVLDISKIEAGQLQVMKEPFDLREAIDKTAQTVKPMVEKKGLALEVILAPDVGTITSDRRRVEQALLNLLSNAVKFTEKGGISIACETSGEALIISIKDTGIGIKREEMDRLFKPFQQLQSGIGRQYEGTGLGLSICKRLVELLGGTLSVTSQWGQGSTFAITLPIFVL